MACANFHTVAGCSFYLTFLTACFLGTQLLLSGCDGVEVSNLVLEFQHDVWEGEGAWMRCTWHPATADVSQLSWYKNEVDDQHLVYYYSTRTSHSKYVHAYNDLENRAVGKQFGNVHEIYINKTVLEDEGSYFCQYSAVTGNKMLTVGVRPTDLSVTGLDQWVKVNTQVDVTCKVGKVKPKADLYWRKGDTMTPTATSAVVTELADDTFQLVSSFKVSFTKSDHHRQFHCIVTRPGDSSVIWTNISKTVNVFYVPSCEVKCSETPTQGKTVTLTCDITDGRPRTITKVTWKKGDSTLSSTGTTLTISSADHTSDDGQYSCAAENLAGRGDFSLVFDLEINYVPSCEVKCSENPTQGKTVTLTCDITDGRPRTITKVTWKKGDSTLSSTGTTLTISSADHTSDDGQYSCAAENLAGRGDFSLVFDLEINYPLSTRVTKTSSGRPVDGKSVILTCDITDGRPTTATKVSWRRGSNTLSSTGTTLTISRADHTRHDGQYSCAADNLAGHGLFGSTYDLEINYPPSTKVTQRGSVTPTDAGSLTLTCGITDGKPRNVIMKMMWKKGNSVITSSGRYKLTDSDKQLTISPLDHSQDDGHFTCAAKNTAGQGSYGTALELLVHYKPSVSVVTPKPVVEEQSVTIGCHSQGARPNVNKVRWKKGQEDIVVTGDRYTGGTVQTPSLTIKKTMRTDAGQYICQLSNDVGQNTGTVTLRVFFSPRGKAAVNLKSKIVAIGEQVSLTCSAPTNRGNPAASWFYWRKESSDFNSNTTVLTLRPSSVDKSGKYSCVAGNWIGQSDYSDWTTVTVQAPAKVEYPDLVNIQQRPAFDDKDFNMTCTVSGSGNVTVTWKKDNKSYDPSDFDLTNVPLTDGHYMYGQTNAKNSTLTWKVTQRIGYFTCKNIAHFDGSYTCAASTQTAGKATREESKAFVVNVQYEAHWSYGPTLTAATFNETSKEIACSVCANPQPQFQWTFQNATLRRGIHMTGDKITLDVVGITDFGTYQCTATNNVNGETRTAHFKIRLDESGPAREPQDFTILDNHTSVALTLRWRPGFDGGHPPQTFTLQYMLFNGTSQRTWKDMFQYTLEDVETWYQATVTGLLPQTEYVFALYSENSRPQYLNRSESITLHGKTTASPEVKITGVKLEKHLMTVTWSFKAEVLRRKRSTSTNVSVVIYYKQEEGVENHYPLNGMLSAEEEQQEIKGQFDVDSKYSVWLNIYEGQLTVSYQATKRSNAAVEKGAHMDNGKDVPNKPLNVIIGASVAAAIVIIIIICLIVILLHRRKANNKECNGVDMKQDSMLMVSKENEMVDGYSNAACTDVEQADNEQVSVEYSQVNKKKKEGESNTKQTDDDDAEVYTDVMGKKAAHENEEKKKPENKMDDQDNDEVVYIEVKVKSKQGGDNKATKDNKMGKKKTANPDDEVEAVMYTNVTVTPKQDTNPKQAEKNPPVAPKPVGKGKSPQKPAKNGKVANPPVSAMPKNQCKKGKSKQKDEIKHAVGDDGSNENQADNLYMNVEESGGSNSQKPSMNVGPDGTIYADLSFAQSAPAAVEHDDDGDDDDDKVVYAAIDFNKK